MGEERIGERKPVLFYPAEMITEVLGWTYKYGNSVRSNNILRNRSVNRGIPGWSLRGAEGDEAIFSTEIASLTSFARNDEPVISPVD